MNHIEYIECAERMLLTLRQNTIRLREDFQKQISNSGLKSWQIEQLATLENLKNSLAAVIEDSKKLACLVSLIEKGIDPRASIVGGKLDWGKIDQLSSTPAIFRKGGTL